MITPYREGEGERGGERGREGEIPRDKNCLRVLFLSTERGRGGRMKGEGWN
jgi:hypothetical protein